MHFLSIIGTVLLFTYISIVMYNFVISYIERKHKHNVYRTTVYLSILSFFSLTLGLC